MVKFYRRFATPYLKGDGEIQKIHLGRTVDEVRNQKPKGTAFDSKKVKDIAIVSFESLKSLAAMAGVDLVDAEEKEAVNG